MTNGSMTKAELVEEVSRVSDLTKKHSEVIVDTVFKSIIDALHRGEKIELRGFGSFRLRRREPRKGRNPKTGDKVDVPPKKVPYFKPGKELKELINREPEAPPAPTAPAPVSVDPDIAGVYTDGSVVEPLASSLHSQWGRSQGLCFLRGGN
jgi:integration host factor subunit beta